MKQGIILGLVLLLTPFISFADFQTDLHYGSTGADVTALQEFLTEQGVYSGPISGNFYTLTLKGVRTFQSAEGIVPVSGYVGPITRSVINQILAMEAPTTEGNATTTQPIVDLSQQTPKTNQSVQPATIQSTMQTTPVFSGVTAPQTCTPTYSANAVQDTPKWASVYITITANCVIDPNTYYHIVGSDGTNWMEGKLGSSDFNTVEHGTKIISQFGAFPTSLFPLTLTVGNSSTTISLQ